MPKSHRQHGLSLMEIAFAIVIFAFIVTAAAYGVQVVKSAKVKALIIQMTQIKNASETFKSQYGTWPGDFAGATNRLRDCNSSRLCENGNGDQIVASANSNGCRMPGYTSGEQAFPCTSITGGNETAQFWRHLVLAGLVENISLRGNRYTWGESFPKVRLGGGLQILYNDNPGNGNARNLTGHFFVHQRVPTIFHWELEAVGDGTITPADAFRIDQEIDDGLPDTGIIRAIGGWGCRVNKVDNAYEGSAQMDCMILYRFSS